MEVSHGNKKHACDCSNNDLEQNSTERLGYTVGVLGVITQKYDL